MHTAPNLEWMLELTLAGLLAATLFHAIRLERTLRVLRRDRSMLEDLLAGFRDSTQEAELGMSQLRAAADGAGRALASQIDAARSLKDDLLFLQERGSALGDRLEGLVRSAQPTAAPQRTPEMAIAASETPRLRSQAERDLLRALRRAR